jgi:hypothetical protein
MACLLAALGFSAASLVAAQTAGAAALGTEISVYPAEQPENGLTMARVRGEGASFTRIVFSWASIAPGRLPRGFDPANPSEPRYRWGALDRVVANAVAHGLEPVLDTTQPPAWAQLPQGAGEQHPDPAQLGLFAHAAAAHYSGSQPGVPVVRYWAVWNEPNASLFLAPQIEGSRIVSVETYRTMVNDFAAAVHGVRPDDVVIAGELFPNGINRQGTTAIAPLEFTRLMFCLSRESQPHRICNAQVAADVWSVHPYSSGGPSTKPANPGNIWIANLRSLVELVRAGQRLGGIVSPHPVQTWVTEFSWDSNPPDPRGVPAKLQQRWVAEALYRSWQAQINVFGWFLLRDQPLSSSPFQSGLYFACSAGIYCDTPKPAASAFRFPFVAYPSSRHRTSTWGRTPGGVPGQVKLELRAGHSWRILAVLRTDGDGIFTRRVKLPSNASMKWSLLRAVQVGGGSSPAFSLHHPRDIPVEPFGSAATRR